MRFVSVAAPVTATAVLLIATLPPVDSGGQFAASALADDKASGGNGGGHPGASGDNDDNDDDGNDGDDGAGHGGDPGATAEGNGDNGGNRGGHNGVRADNGSGGKGGGTRTRTRTRTGKAGGGDAHTRGGEHDGGETSAGAPLGDMTLDELEDRVLAGETAAGPPGFRATELSADQEAAAIAAGWAAPD
jgi:hypothetical protein